MGKKTLTELTDEMARELNTLKSELTVLGTQFDQADMMTVRERIAVHEKLIDEVKRLAEEAERRGERLAVLESQFAEFKKQHEEKGRRWWQLWIGVGLVGFTFVANLVIQFILLFTRKPG